MSNNGFNYQTWYDETIAEKERLEKELGRVTKLTEVLASFAAEEKSPRASGGEFIVPGMGDFEQLATLNRKIQVLYFMLDIIRSLSAEGDTDKRYKLIMEKAAQLVDGDKSAIFLLDPATNELCAKVREDQAIVETRFPSDLGLAGQVLATGKTINVLDTAKNKHFYAEIDEKPVYRAKTMIVAPLRDEAGVTFGVLEIFNKRTGTFSADDEYLLQGFAAQVAMALKSRGEDNSSLMVSNTMLVIMKALASGLDIDSLLQSLVRKCSQVMNADRSSLFLVDFAKQELWSKVAEGDNVNEIRFPMTAGIAGHVATSGDTVNIPDAYEDPRFNKDIDLKTGYRTRTILCAPLRNESGKIIGVIQVLNKKEGIFMLQDERIIHSFASQVSKVLKSAQFLLNLITIMEEAKSYA